MPADCAKTVLEMETSGAARGPLGDAWHFMATARNMLQRGEPGALFIGMGPCLAETGRARSCNASIAVFMQVWPRDGPSIKSRLTDAKSDPSPPYADFCELTCLPRPRVSVHLLLAGAINDVLLVCCGGLPAGIGAVHHPDKRQRH